ncbi:N-terminal phage integrase SAM-like domain-containing protein [Hoyosella subflava]|uniref:Prophage integrase n=1 Tax=Hoyosella subflava (strain DSM 45089 / JCM 17490 / NBRC 109087 / DQS3-9A1) TaxID=443218 RepID=F6ELB8_HOYSD|nr:N-terminal phage integrase SAM-like domain-containing protein [Hoyosella subflava]AEF39210.1 Prophage integrase [Hoyosella subflava DQS3-9A1]
MGEVVDTKADRAKLENVYASWLSSRPDLSAKVRRGYEDNWRLRVKPAFGSWPIARITSDDVQDWVNRMTAAGLGPRTVRCTHSVLRMTLDHAIGKGQLVGKNPAKGTKFPPLRHTTHVFLTAAEVAGTRDEVWH